MPTDSVGVSEITPVKHEHLRAIFSKWCAITRAVLNKHDWANPSVLYVDATAGPALRPNYAGSPVIFLQCALAHQLPHEMILIEQDFHTFAELHDAMAHVPGATLRCTDYRNVLPEIPRSRTRFGLLYVDPNGPSEIDTETISAFCARHIYTDLLVYVSATALKRYVSGGMRLLDLVGNIDKDVWFMREPIKGDKWYWTFLLGTGAKSPLKQYAKIKLWRLEDARLKEALFRCQYTREEQATMIQPPLIATMPNT